MKILHIARDKTPHPDMMKPTMLAALEQLGELTVLNHGNDMSDEERAAHIRECDILLTGWWSAEIPDSIAEDRGNLKYICNITGTVQPCVKECHVAAGIPVTNWGDSPAQSVAEGAMVLLLAVMKNLRLQGKLVEAGGWGGHMPLTSLYGLRVGIYGLGVIGRRFVEMMRPFGAKLTGYDPYLSEFPEGVARVDSLEALFAGSDAVVIHAGLSEETTHSVTAHLLSLLPNNGILINTARGGIVDQNALLAELETGRLRAGIDVLDGSDSLPINHPARQWPNLVLTCHQVSGASWPDQGDILAYYQELALENIRRFMAGEPLKFQMDLTRFLRST